MPLDNDLSAEEWSEIDEPEPADRADAVRETFRRHLMRDLSNRVHRHKGQPKPSMLDLGCGAGHTTALLEGHGFKAQGLDLAPDCLAAARVAHPGLTFELGDALDVPFAADTFDSAAAFGLIQHLEDWWRVVAEAVRIIRPGGFALIETDRALPRWEVVLRFLPMVARREATLRTAWRAARVHGEAADLPWERGPRKFSRRDLVNCVKALPVLQLIVHDPRRARGFHEEMWAVTLLKREHAAQTEVPPLIVECQHCRLHGLRQLRVSRG